MNINELHSLTLSDYTKFHDILNPDLWDEKHELRSEVKQTLLNIAQDFKTFLGIKDFDLKDITISGSNAGYNYNPTSDIDLHLVVDLPEADVSEVYRELFDAKKYQYNDSHDIKIRGSDVELYVQNANQPHVSQGIYSLLNNRWVIFPKRIKTDIDDISVISKYQDIKERIDSALSSDDLEKSRNLLKKIKNMRVDGLAKHGEFGVENLTFKLLRSQGLIGSLRDHANRLHDRELSLTERGRKSRRSRQRYVYGSFWSPGFSTSSDSSSGGNGGESIAESVNQAAQLKTFALEIIRELDIQHRPKIVLHTKPSWTQKTGSFGRYDPEQNVLHLATSDRHILDILRTMAHELVHCAQRHQGQLPPDAGETGSAYEDEANALAGRIMRGFAERRPELFNDIQLEESSGYIPTETEKNDPRFSNALTIDIRPGETGRQANKLGLQTDSQGRPALLRPGKKTRLAETRQKTDTQEDWHANDRPPGPETKPTMPRGTVRVDVSDMYDWYKLGKQISNLDQADAREFGKGPPSTIVSFGDEDLEHKYISSLKKLGLTTTDIDPVDPNQPKGMKRQKVDPTFNVNETQDENSQLLSINVAKQNINKILAAAQRIYDDWDESEVDTYAGGGICHLIADAICDVMWQIGIECTTVSCSYEQHVYVAVKVEEGVYTIDIPYSIYEEGGGFSWKKLPDIKFDPRNVVFYKVSGDPEEFENYTALEESRQGVAEGSIKDLHIDLQDQQWDAIVGYVINGLKKNMDIGQMELNLYKYAGREMFDVDRALKDHGFKSIADLADHIQQNNSRYVPPTFNLGEQDLAESLRIDVPNEEWLKGKIDYAKRRGRDSFGAPYFNSTTAYNDKDVRVPIEILRRLPGMRGEQQNVRQQDLQAIKKILKDTGQLPLGRDGKEYVPFVLVAYNGEAWVSEGNHRIMAAAELYDQGDMRFASLPIELKYFDGGERVESGPLHPSKISQSMSENFVNKVIQESFDQPYPIIWSRGEYGDVDGFTTLADGSRLELLFNLEDKESKQWMFQFYRDDRDDVSGQGDAQRVFATVLNALKIFLRRRRPNMLHFSASRETDSGQKSLSRSNLYTRLMQRYAPTWGYNVEIYDDGGRRVDYVLTPKVKQKTNENFADGRNPGRIGQQDVSEDLSWSSLDEGLSLENKMAIFEEYAIRGNLTGSIDQDKKDYFISLFKLVNTPVENKKYIVAPLALIGNKIMPLDSPAVMRFLGQDNNSLVFDTASGKKTYPSKIMRDLSVFNTFTFASYSAYDKFRTALSLKFDVSLPSIAQEQGVAEGSYDISDFKMNVYESMADFRKWMRSPKKNDRGMTRHIVDIYENVIVKDNTLIETSKAFIKRQQQAKEFNENFKQFNEREKVQIKLGNKIALLSSTVIPDDNSSRIELSGFITPKKIVKINLDSEGLIDSIKFDDGSIFPEASEFTTVGGIHITNTIFFPDGISAAKAYTSIWMLISNLEGQGWKVESYMNEDVAENFADGRKPGRKGLAKRMGVPTKASVSRLRQIAKSSSGEKARMAHWVANMKAGKAKKS